MHSTSQSHTSTIFFRCSQTFQRSSSGAARRFNDLLQVQPDVSTIYFRCSQTFDRSHQDPMM
eukprot:365648-Chlamydomonas_euryale.AAC.3